MNLSPRFGNSVQLNDSQLLSRIENSLNRAYQMLQTSNSNYTNEYVSEYERLVKRFNDLKMAASVGYGNLLTLLSNESIEPDLQDLERKVNNLIYTMQQNDSVFFPSMNTVIRQNQTIQPASPLATYNRERAIKLLNASDLKYVTPEELKATFQNALDAGLTKQEIAQILRSKY